MHLKIIYIVRGRQGGQNFACIIPVNAGQRRGQRKVFAYVLCPRKAGVCCCIVNFEKSNASRGCRTGRIFSLPADVVENYIVVMVRHRAFRQRERELREVAVEEPRGAEALFSDENIEDGMELREMIRAMPERYRQVLELRLVMELSTAEAAEALNLSVTTVTTRLQRGREMLQAKLRKEGYVL